VQTNFPYEQWIFQHQEEMGQNISKNSIRVFYSVACITVVNIAQLPLSSSFCPLHQFIVLLVCQLIEAGGQENVRWGAQLCMCVSEASFLCVHLHRHTVWSNLLKKVPLSLYAFKCLSILPVSFCF
jgi:hypothetical protein